MACVRMRGDLGLSSTGGVAADGALSGLCKALDVPCDAFMQEAAEREPPGPGRPRTPEPEAAPPPAEEKPKGKGRRKGKA